MYPPTPDHHLINPLPPACYVDDNALWLRRRQGLDRLTRRTTRGIKEQGLTPRVSLPATSKDGQIVARVVPLLFGINPLVDNKTSSSLRTIFL